MSTQSNDPIPPSRSHNNGDWTDAQTGETSCNLTCCTSYCMPTTMKTSKSKPATLLALPGDIIHLIMAFMLKDHANPRDVFLPFLLTTKQLCRRDYDLHTQVVYPFVKQYVEEMEKRRYMFHRCQGLNLKKMIKMGDEIIKMERLLRTDDVYEKHEAKHANLHFYNDLLKRKQDQIKHYIEMVKEVVPSKIITKWIQVEEEDF